MSDAKPDSAPHGQQPTQTKPNRLAQESSPYLLQHAHNPVDWFPWGEAAFAEARRRDVPIFLSIGYATCHWCHVMEHESFEDPEAAALLNRAFVCVKVDREERPDLDQVYMQVALMSNGHGGWPLTVLLTADKKPFFAGTYIPKHSRGGRLGLLDWVPRIEALWKDKRADLLEASEDWTRALNRKPDAVAGGMPENSAAAAVDQLTGRYDKMAGGFGRAPKFPSPHNLTFLLQRAELTGEDALREMALFTLRKMRLGGMFDQVGLGFHRYSTDSDWFLPHFEKMLYDQANLLAAYARAFAATGDAFFRRVAQEIVTYVLRDMTHPEGGFYSAEDADSEGEEGLFHTWTYAELETVLDGELLAQTAEAFGLRPEGNFHDEATGEPTGRNHFALKEALPEFDQGGPAWWRKAREQLFAVREMRVHPLKDDKILTDWNGLMAASLALAGRLLDEPSWVRAATACLEFVDRYLSNGDGTLKHRFRLGQAGLPAHLDDYAAQIRASLETFAVVGDPRWLRRAVALQAQQDRWFWDEERGGYFTAAADNPDLLARMKEAYDGASPSGNSLALANLQDLERLTGVAAYGEKAEALIRWAAGEVGRMPSGHCALLEAWEAGRAGGADVVLVGDPGESGFESLKKAALEKAPPRTWVILKTPAWEASWSALAPYTQTHTRLDGKATAYVCRRQSCRLPVTDIEGLLRELGS